MVLAMSYTKIPINVFILQKKTEEFGHKLGYEHFKAKCLTD